MYNTKCVPFRPKFFRYHFWLLSVVDLDLLICVVRLNFENFYFSSVLPMISSVLDQIPDLTVRRQFWKLGTLSWYRSADFLQTCRQLLPIFELFEIKALENATYCFVWPRGKTKRLQIWNRTRFVMLVIYVGRQILANSSISYGN